MSSLPSPSASPKALMRIDRRAALGLVTTRSEKPSRQAMLDCTPPVPAMEMSVGAPKLPPPVPRIAGGEARRRVEGSGRARAQVSVDADAPVDGGQVGLAVDGDGVEPPVAVHVHV
ncbi:hypothetical protein BE20_13345 [Sorangium cellulosum]|nr:hypothetical protein BE20_13345 [Sorangium cellulosum]